MEGKRSDGNFIIVYVKQRKKNIIKDFIDLKLLAEQKVTVFKVPPSDGGRKNKDKEKKNK